MTAPTPPTTGGLEGMADKLGGSDILGKITELFSVADPKLDRLKESILGDLEDLKQSPELESLAINMWKSAEEGLRKDLSELNVPNAQIETLVAEAKTKWIAEIGPEQMRTILESPEKIALDKYVSELENLPVLTGIMASAEPKKNWEIWLSKITDKIPGLSTIIGPILALLGIKGKNAEAIIATLQKNKKKKPEKPTAPTAEEPEVAKKGEEVEVELTSEQKAALAPLKEFTIDPTTVKKDMDYLKSQGLNQEQIVALAKKAAEGGSNLNKIKNQIGDTGVKFRLMDAYVLDGDYLQPGQISLIVEKSSEIKKTPDDIRKYLDNSHKIKKGDDNNKVATVLDIEKLRATA